ncbi:Oxidoreductase HTATIP2-like [Oopsacas minuta]|uniref:Oxidoreductase HTATIP2-like n=1 Tax=Oopsacas minuta TaxID=111878 RepID=A0AAV7KEV2_9METZ|nr:Oxidoreductase HTATIP2-like [Oopsacas minuta]
MAEYNTSHPDPQSVPDDNEPKSKPTGNIPLSQSSSINVVVIGATGVTGRYVVAELLLCHEITSVRVVARRKYDVPREYVNSVILSNAIQEGKLVEHIVDLEAVSDGELRGIFEGAHTFYNCLGSTRSKAGSKERFIQIDTDIPVRFARVAKEMGVKHMSLLTSSGSDAKSSFFYLKMKGLLENTFRDISFPILSIFRPGLLGRKEQMKFGEKLFSLIWPAIQTDDVARGIVQESLNVITGSSLPVNPIYYNAQILVLNAERLRVLRSADSPPFVASEQIDDTTKPLPVSESSPEQDTSKDAKPTPVDTTDPTAVEVKNTTDIVEDKDSSIPTGLTTEADNAKSGDDDTQVIIPGKEESAPEV